MSCGFPESERAPFDPDTLRNHWITCPKQGEARQAFPRKP